MKSALGVYKTFAVHKKKTVKNMCASLAAPHRREHIEISWGDSTRERRMCLGRYDGCGADDVAAAVAAYAYTYAYAVASKVVCGKENRGEFNTFFVFHGKAGRDLSRSCGYVDYGKN